MEEGQKLKIKGVEYIIAGVIGKGAAGEVFNAQKVVKGKKIDEYYAIKRVFNYNKAMIRDAVDQEIQLQNKFRDDKCVINLYGAEVIDCSIYIVFELGECSLRTRIESKFITEKEYIHIISDIAQGIMAVHSKKIIHRDIKPQNIILQNRIYKITDFGISVQKDSETSSVGTPLYWPPQVLFCDDEEQYTQKLDIWSLGIVAFEAFFGMHPFFYLENCESYKKAINHLKQNIPKLTEKFTFKKIVDHLRKLKLKDKADHIEAKLKSSQSQLIETFPMFFQKNPSDRPDIEIVVGIFSSLKDKISQRKSKRSRIKKGIEMPDIIKFMVGTLNNFHALEFHLSYQSCDQVEFALELIIWYLDSRDYGGTGFIEYECLARLKEYRKPKNKLWEDVKSILTEYYFYLRNSEALNFFQNLQHFKLSILLCSVWNTINQVDNFCREVKKAAKCELELNNITDLINFSQTFTDRQYKDCEDWIMNKYLIS